MKAKTKKIEVLPHEHCDIRFVICCFVLLGFFSCEM